MACSGNRRGLRQESEFKVKAKGVLRIHEVTDNWISCGSVLATFVSVACAGAFASARAGAGVGASVETGSGACACACADTGASTVAGASVS